MLSRLKMFLLFLIVFWAFSLSALGYKPYNINTNSISSKKLNVYHLKFPPLNYSIPKYSKIPLIGKNSTLYYAKDENTKLLKIKIYFPIGSIYDREGYYGEIYLTLYSLLNGGTKKFTPNQVDSILDFYGINISFNVYNEYSVIYMDVVDDYKDIATDLLKDLLNFPRFDSTIIEIKKRTIYAALRREEEEPNSFISYKYKEFILNNKIYSHRIVGDTNSLKNINQEVIKKNYERIRKIGNFKIVIVGNISKFNAIKTSYKILSNFYKKNTWHHTDRVLRLEKISDVYDSVDVVILVSNKGYNQTFIRFGFRGIKYNSKDYYLNNISTYIIGGGGFSSIILDELRVKRGLTYAAGFYHKPYIYIKGYYLGYCQTQNKRSIEALETIINVFNRLKKYGVSKDKIDLSKETFINQIPFLYASKMDYISLVVKYEIQNRDPRLLEKLPEIYGSFSYEKVNNYIKNISSNRLKFFIITSKDNVDNIKNFFENKGYKIIIVQ